MAQSNINIKPENEIIIKEFKLLLEKNNIPVSSNKEFAVNELIKYFGLLVKNSSDKTFKTATNLKLNP